MEYTKGGIVKDQDKYIAEIVAPHNLAVIEVVHSDVREASRARDSVMQVLDGQKPDQDFALAKPELTTNLESEILTATMKYRNLSINIHEESISKLSKLIYVLRNGLKATENYVTPLGWQCPSCLTCYPPNIGACRCQAQLTC